MTPCLVRFGPVGVDDVDDDEEQINSDCFDVHPFPPEDYLDDEDDEDEELVNGESFVSIPFEIC